MSSPRRSRLDQGAWSVRPLAMLFVRAQRLGRTGRLVLAAALSLAVVAGLSLSAVVAEAAPGCATNAVVCENALPGSPESDWEIDGAGDATIQGYATQMSVNHGSPVSFKISTDASAYSIQIFRLGYYQGLGARKVADVTPSAPLPQTQPACATDAATEIFDCGTWAVSATWNVPADAVSGVYLALLTRGDTGGRSQIAFVVRDDSSRADVVFQTSDATWQAYNTYGGSDFYTGLANGRAYKVSYNRPVNTRGNDQGRDYLFANEYPMLRFLEQNGYDTSYISSLDTDQRGADLLQHKIFVSTGHDEYWSAAQRSNVEKARDAGVNLAFFSGNEVYWRTRWEPSQDGTATPNRTLVCYKDTWADAPLDPNGPTSTWRDARGASAPENALTGTIYKSNNTDLPITVNAEEGKLRLWRGTALASQAAGSQTALAPHTVGYESDEDLDNGFRPQGAFNLSTTTGPTPQYLTDFGRNVVAGTTTHHLTMYRAASGALVFGAGTVQWAWGIDTHHDGTVAPVNVAMQQAMVNLFADMSAKPLSLSTPGVKAATKSTDTTVPTAVITSPTASTSLGQGSKVTVTGTATDVGGVVAGVEVSLDAGRSWHPATGRSSFSYTGIVSGTGTSVVQARAVDDSGNLQTKPAVVATPVACPCTLFGQTVPGTAATTDSGAFTLGVRFSSSADGFITGIRFYKGAGNTGTHTGTLYSSDGKALASVAFSDETSTGWQSATFASAVPVTAGTTYVAAYTAPNGRYAYDSQYFAYAGITAGPLTAPGAAEANGVFAAGAAFPNRTYAHANYWVDAVYNVTDPTPLSVTAKAPIDGASSVSPGTVVFAVLSRDAVASSVTATLTDASGRAVAGATAYDPSTRKVTFTPAAPLAATTTYTAAVNANPSVAGIAVKPGSWSFTTARPDQAPGVCPCGLSDDSAVPTVLSSGDNNSVELGTAFTSDTAGQITGVRFYKGVDNTGTHTVSLWSTGGKLLATATVGKESTTGWQTASFDSPVSIDADTTYIASYRAPNGGYSFSAGALGAPTDRSPLHTPGNAGRFSYADGAPLTSSSASYHVDPVFVVPASAKPEVASLTPADKTTSTPVSTTIAVTFTGAIQPGSAVITLTAADGSTVSGNAGAPTPGTTATFVPSAPLAAGTTYTVSVSGAKNLSGSAMDKAVTSTFTTSGASVCPCSILSSTARPTRSDSGDGGPITVGVRFSSEVDGYVLGLRYWRDAANTGTHTGALYAADGTRLAGVTFADSGTGWQTATLDTAVPVTAGTTYVAAVYLPVGHYAITPNFFAAPFVNRPLTATQGVFASGADAFPTATYGGNHYFVDATFAKNADVVAPKVSSVKAVASTTGATITWKTDEASSSTVQYGTSAAALTSTATGPGSTTDHAVSLTGLTTGKTYYYKVVSVDATGNTGSSDVATVTPLDATAPKVSAVKATGAGKTATVTWTTDEDSSSTVAYGTSSGSLDSTASGPGSTKTHTVTLDGLTPGKTYSYKVVSVDAAGNTGSSDVASFTQDISWQAVSGATSTGSGSNKATFGTATVSGDKLVVPFTATGTSTLPGPNNTCLSVTTATGQVRLLPSSVSLTTNKSGSYAGTLTYPLSWSGSYSVQYSCSSPFTKATIGTAVLVPKADAKWQATSGAVSSSGSNKATFGTATLSGTTLTVPFTATGSLFMPNPSDTCLTTTNGSVTIPQDPTSVSLTTNRLGSYAGTITYQLAGLGSYAVQYDCSSSYSKATVGSYS